MKKRRLLNSLILTFAVVIAGVFAFSNRADAAESYSYTVKIILGGTGQENASFSSDLSGALTVGSDAATVFVSGDNTTIIIEGLQYDDEISFDTKSGVDADLPYYVKGMRRSGSNALAPESFKVTKDDSFVIAYGVMSEELIPYNVYYKDDAGNTLLASKTYYGVAGDDFYIPYQYISGYTPNTMNIHVNSLKAGEEYTFVYTKGTSASSSSSSGGGTVYKTVTGDTEYTYQLIPRVSDTQPVTNNRVNADGNAATDDTAGQGNGDTDTTTIDDTEMPLGATEEVIEIEDEDTAKGGGSKADNYIRYLIVIAFIGMIIVIISVGSTLKNEYDRSHKN